MLCKFIFTLRQFWTARPPPHSLLHRPSRQRPSSAVPGRRTCQTHPFAVLRFQATRVVPCAVITPVSADTYQPGSKDDFDRLYQTACPRVFRTLSAILADPEAAEDCTQDAFVQAFRAWPRWRPDAPAEAWVHRIAVNRAISHRR